MYTMSKTRSTECRICRNEARKMSRQIGKTRRTVERWRSIRSMIRGRMEIKSVHVEQGENKEAL